MRKAQLRLVFLFQSRVRSGLVTLVLPCVLGVFALSACKGSGTADKDTAAQREKAVIAKATPLLGIYEITKTTRNPKVCTSEGAALSAEGRDGFVVFVMGELMFRKALMAYSCKTVAGCRKHAKKWEGGTFHYSFRKITGGKLTGVKIFTGFFRKSVCKNGHSASNTVVPDGAGVTITVRSTKVDYPANAEGHCDTRIVRKRIKGKPCNELTVIRAKKVASL
jgi:hypothetical protein